MENVKDMLGASPSEACGMLRAKAAYIKENGHPPPDGGEWNKVMREAREIVARGEVGDKQNVLQMLAATGIDEAPAIRTFKAQFERVASVVDKLLRDKELSKVLHP